MKKNMGLWLAGGFIGAYFLITYLAPRQQNGSPRGRSIQGQNFRGTGASEEAYWSGYGEGRHLQVPGRIG